MFIALKLKPQEFSLFGFATPGSSYCELQIQIPIQLCPSSAMFLPNKSDRLYICQRRRRERGPFWRWRRTYSGAATVQSALTALEQPRPLPPYVQPNKSCRIRARRQHSRICSNVRISERAPHRRRRGSCQGFHRWRRHVEPSEIESLGSNLLRIKSRPRRWSKTGDLRSLIISEPQ